MGVTDLWSILSPVQESVPLYSLTGKTLAVDLSLWICEAQHVQAMMGKVTKPHLRNLFFRASSLLRMGVKLVFIMEGEAPKIKAETMSKRTEMAFRGGKTRGPLKPAATKNTGRGRFKAILRECAEMLDCLGIPWVTAAGEAEAMCAFLDAQGLVDGCITSDGDAFLYGAQTVYRNFNMNSKDPQIECYKMSRIEKELHLTRETLIGLAVLLGCDYIPKGVAGVGKEQTLKLIQNLNGQTLLQKFSDWKRNSSEILDVAMKKVGHCLVCRHPGSAKSHERNGCTFCNSKQFCQPQDYDSQCPCEWHRTEHARQASSVEASIKKKTLACDKFPFTEIINEFLVPKDKVVHSFKRRKPNLLLMQNFALEKMEWPKHYTSEKVLILMTYTELMNQRHGMESAAQIEPIRIVKPRIRNGISCFEVMWKKPDHYEFPEDGSLEEVDIVRTVEEENLFTVAYPRIVQIFHKEMSEAKDKKSKKKKAKAEKENPTTSPDTVSELLAQMSLQSSQNRKALPSSKMTLVGKAALQSTSGQCPPATLDEKKPPKQPIHKSDLQTASHTPFPSLSHRREIPPSPSVTGTSSKAQGSPSVSALLEELHLSSIDWDTLSFTVTPSPQCLSSEADPKQQDKSDESNKTDHKTDCGDSAILCVNGLSECPLRERVIMRCVMKSESIWNAREQTTKGKIQSAGFELQGLDSHQASNCSHKPFSENNDICLQAPCQTSRPNELESGNSASEGKAIIKQASKEFPPVHVPPKYTFVKVKPTTFSLLPQRSYSDPSYQKQSIKPQKTQTSVSRTVCVSQDSNKNSDEENQPGTEQRRINLKAKAKFKPQKPKTSQSNNHAECGTSGAVSVKEQLNAESTNKGPKFTTPHKQPTKSVISDLVPQKAMSNVNDDDDSDASIDSPRPLAERLKLKLIK